MTLQVRTSASSDTLLVTAPSLSTTSAIEEKDDSTMVDPSSGVTMSAQEPSMENIQSGLNVDKSSAVDPLYPSTPSLLTQSTGGASQVKVTMQNPKSSLTIFTYQVQLTFGLATYQEVNVANLFAQWFESTNTFLEDFAILPYDSKPGQPITSITQLESVDETFYQQYYSNHRILQHGNLTGMVRFQTSSPWSAIKGYRSLYFSGLKSHSVFLNYTKFKTDTLVVCGFLVGARPVHFHHDEAEEEHKGSLSLDPDELPSQLHQAHLSAITGRRP
jgi:hypothetical protein